MYRAIRSALFVSLAIATTSCSAKNPIGPGWLSSADSLITSLRQQGAVASRGETLPRSSNPFFSPSALVVTLNARTISVFEYANTFAAEADAAKVSADGSSVGNTMISWVGSPHFYQAGSLIVIYAGDDTSVLQPLAQVLGAPFAGR